MAERHLSVKICVGTACFVQGGADLLLYEDFLDSRLLRSCSFEGTSCLGGCKVEPAGNRAPYIEIDGVMHANVTPKRLQALLEEALDA